MCSGCSGRLEDDDSDGWEVSLANPGAARGPSDAEVAEAVAESTRQVMEAIAGEFPAYAPMSAAEVAELAAALGRDLTETEAMRALRRRTVSEAVAAMLGEVKLKAGW